MVLISGNYTRFYANFGLEICISMSEFMLIFSSTMHFLFLGSCNPPFSFLDDEDEKRGGGGGGMRVRAALLLPDRLSTGLGIIYVLCATFMFSRKIKSVASGGWMTLTG